MESTLKVLREDLPERLNPTVYRRGPITVRFGVEFGLVPERLSEFDRLVDTARDRWLDWERSRAA